MQGVRAEAGHGDGPEEWSNLNDLDFQSLKSMLITLGRPKSIHQAALKTKEVRIGTSEHSLAKSMLFSIDERSLIKNRELRSAKVRERIFERACVSVVAHGRRCIVRLGPV